MQDPPPYDTEGHPAVVPPNLPPVGDGIELYNIPSAPPLTEEDERPTYLPGVSKTHYFLTNCDYFSLMPHL